MSMFKRILATLLLSFTFNVAASEYPSKPIRIILGMQPASTLPIISRQLAENVPDKRFVFVNEHKTGQGNLLAYQYAAASKPDGHAIVFASTSVVINPHLYKDAGFKVEDFEPVLFVGKVDNAILVHPSVPFRNVAEMIRYAKSNPNKLMYGHNGFATQSFLAVELLAAMTDTKFTNIPYAATGTDGAIISLFSGELDIHVPVVGRAVGYVNSGKVKILATTGSKRSALFPNVPTVGETIKAFSSSIWYVFLAPKGLAPNVKQAMAEQLASSIAHPSTRRALDNFGIEKFDLNGITSEAFIRAEEKKWSALIAAKGIKAE